MANSTTKIEGEAPLMLSAAAARELRLILEDVHRGLGALVDVVPPADRAAVRVPRAQLSQAMGLFKGTAATPERSA